MKTKPTHLIILQLLLSASLAVTSLCTQAAPSARIINGTEASDPSDFPWQVALFNDKSDVYLSQYCGGTLLSERWVVTAAHCAAASDGTYVAAGIINLAQGLSGEVAKVEKWFVHPGFNKNTFNNDIALLKLATPMDFSRCGANCLPLDIVTTSNESSVMGFGDTAIITGWGNRTNVDGAGDFPYVLNSAAVAIVDCVGTGYSNVSYYPVYPITSNMFCAGDAAYQYDTCQGDSGGPIIVYDTDGTTPLLAGITSWGEGCAVATFPGVYTRISQFKSWIDDTIESNSFDADAVTLSEIRNSDEDKSSSVGSINWIILSALVLLGLGRRIQQRAQRYS